MSATSAAAQRRAGLSREEAKALAERVLALSSADEARVNIRGSISGNTRFALNQITTSGDSGDTTVTVTSAFGTREASASTNRLDDEGLREVVARSERLARLTPENPERMPELAPQEYVSVPAYFESTASLDAERRARVAEQAMAPASERGLQAAGFLDLSAGSTAVANRNGLFAFHEDSDLAYTLTVRTAAGDGSGWAGGAHNDFSKIDTAAVAERALEKAIRSRGAQPVPPGAWTVILEPAAVANLLSLMFLGFSARILGISARAADEGRSFFSRPDGGNRIREKLFDERVTLVSDPTDPELLDRPFDDDGLPLRHVVWVEGGVLRNLAYGRFWAQKQGKEPTGFPSSLRMMGGDASLDEMIASTERGIFVTRFWYIRAVDPRTLLYTGLTRDGTFLIENGRVTRAVQNLRFNESPALMLSRLEALGPAVRVSAEEAGGRGEAIIVPPLKIRNFTFTSVSEAV